ncbi:hypothetical protein TNCV_4084611 [Trichonephila clavipes]|nr:hypothetical protein TNCV_4084611 [Trichonephila clavipes]
MAESLSICTKEGRKTVIRFLFAEVVKSTEIIHRMQVQYGGSCLSRSKIYEWIERIKQERTFLCYVQRLGSSSTSTTKDSVSQTVGLAA